MCALLAPSAHAAGEVAEVFVPDPGFEGGGFWELTVDNMSGVEIFWFAVANDDADVVFTHPSLVGIWRASRGTKQQWQNNILPFQTAGFPIPDTSLIDWNTYFDTSNQVVYYYMLVGGAPILPAQVLSGFRFLSGAAGSPYVLVDDTGTVVSSGETNEDPLPTEDTTWGGVKALFE